MGTSIKFVALRIDSFIHLSSIVEITCWQYVVMVDLELIVFLSALFPWRFYDTTTCRESGWSNSSTHLAITDGLC